MIIVSALYILTCLYTDSNGQANHYSTQCAFQMLIARPTVQVHPGLSVKIQSITPSHNDKHTPMHVSWNMTPAAKPDNTVTGAQTKAHVMEAAAPADALSQHDQSPSVGSTASNESSMSLLQQHLQDATTKSISSATDALSLIQPALGLQPDSTANFLLLDGSSTSSQPETEDVNGSSQTHMGFNHEVIHDSSESHGFASVNGTDVVPINEMPDVAVNSSDSSVDWAQDFRISTSDDLSPVADAVASEEEGKSSSASSADSSTPALKALNDAIGSEAALHGGIITSTDEALIATKLAEPEAASSDEVSSELSTSESPSREELSPEVAVKDDSAWVQADPYSDSLQGMIHPTSRMFRAPGK